MISSIRRLPSTSSSAPQVCPAVQVDNTAQSDEIVTVNRSQRELLDTVAMELQEDLPIVEITSVIVNLYDDKELREMAAIAVYDEEETGPNSVNSSRLGVTTYNGLCGTCNQSSMRCRGHYGYIRLNRMVNHPHYVSQIIQVLTSVCNSCARLKLDRRSMEEAGVLRMTGPSRLRAIAEKSSGLQCTHDHSIDGVKRCNPNPIYNSSKGKDGEVITYSFAELGTGGKKGTGKPQPRSSEEAFGIITRISDEDAAMLGFVGTHPRSMILQSIPVIPVNSRPSIIIDGRVEHHFFTLQYMKIIKANNELKKLIGGGPNAQNARDTWYAELQRAISQLMDSEGDDKKNVGIKQTVHSKTGLIRQNMAGKKVNFTGRTVAGPDPTLKFGEVAVPMWMAQYLPVDENVNSYNINHLTNLLKMDPPRIVSIIPIGGPFKGITFAIKRSMAKDVKLSIGDKVKRWLNTGDYAIVNRQPTIQKESMRAMRVVLRPGNTIRISTADTTPFNADFDGDELNIHVVRSAQAAAELTEIMSSQNCIMNQQSNRPMAAPSFDTLTGAYILTMDDVTIDPATYMDCLMNIQNQDGLPSLNGRLRQAGIRRYSGRALFSAILPPDFYYVKGNVLVVNGVLVKGTLSKETIGVSQNSMVQALHEDYGAARTADFITDAAFLINRWLKGYGFTIGLGDCILQDQGLTAEEKQQRQDELDQIGYGDVMRLRDEIDTIEVESSRDNIMSLAREAGVDADTLDVVTPVERNTNVVELQNKIQRLTDRIDTLKQEVLTERFERVIEIKNREITALTFDLNATNNLLGISVEGIELAKQELRDIMARRDSLPQLRDRLAQLESEVDMDEVARIQDKYINLVKSREGSVARSIQQKNEETIASVEAMGLEPEDPYRAERHANEIGGMVNISKTMGELASETGISYHSPLNIMPNSGSKGSKVNTAQITAGLYQQFILGKRVEPTLMNGTRCLPYFAANETNPKARGYCTNSFFSGLDPSEFFYHAAAGRMGLTDTAIKTAETGRLHRDISEALKPLILEFDGTVRGPNSKIYQFAYGTGTGMDPGKLSRFKSDSVMGDDQFPLFVDIRRMFGRINAQYGFIDLEAKTEESSISYDPTIDPERFENADFDIEDGYD
uniref:DNA-directed RNA polymerase n=1 Tax=viral metagenome TaxID=1070528 RepID=A0A6C0BKT1_9ZZZZ